jgi:hypothetical protein
MERSLDYAFFEDVRIGTALPQAEEIQAEIDGVRRTLTRISYLLELHINEMKVLSARRTFVLVKSSEGLEGSQFFVEGGDHRIGTQESEPS